MASFREILIASDADDDGHIDQAMIKNRLSDEEISEDERQMIEDFVE